MNSTGKGSETEGGEAPPLILQHPLSAWDLQFFSGPLRDQWKAAPGEFASSSGRLIMQMGCTLPPRTACPIPEVT
jgi:hypothetical protein